MTEVVVAEVAVASSFSQASRVEERIRADERADAHRERAIVPCGRAP
jgi:hypothetical protein